MSAHRFPAQSTSFIGRRGELAELMALVPEKRLVTLTGPGGTGKTRLVCAVGEQLSDRFADGAWFVDLASLTDAAFVPTVVASALDIPVSTSDVTTSLLGGLDGRECLIVLDNCEHLLAACSELTADLIAGCPSITILATSREELALSGETVWGVPPMPVPSISDDPDELMTYDAVRLLTERASMADRTFTVSSTNATGVVRVIERLDGIPLAVELAAAWTRVLTPDEIASRLDDRFGLLTRGPVDAPARHRTLRAAIDWSYELLTEPQRNVLGALSVFRGGFTVHAAEAICADDDAGSGVLDALHSLVESNLVTADTSGEESRFSMLESIREYANETLSPGRRSAVRDRHLAWFKSFAERWNAPLSGESDALWHLRFDGDHDNIRHALRWSLDGGSAREGLELASFTAAYWLVRANLVEGRSWLAQLIDAAGSEIGPDPSDESARTALAGGHHELGRMAIGTGDYPTADAAMTRAAALLERIEHPTDASSKLHAAVLDGLAQLALFAGKLDEARERCERSIAILRSIGERLNEARALTVLGDIHVRQGDFAGGRALVEQGMAISREEGDHVGVANAAIQLGNVLVTAGESAAAKRTFEQALALCRDIASPGGVAYAWHKLGTIAADEGDFARAISLTDEALRQYLDIGLTAMGADMALWIGSFALRAGSPDRSATSYLRAAEFDADRVGPWALEGLAEAAATAGEATDAGVLLGAASIVRETTGRPPADDDVEMIERATTLAVHRAGRAAFDRAYSSGRLVSLDEALDTARRLASALTEVTTARPGPSFVLEGEVWVVSFEGRTIQVGDSKGMGHLARLVSSPGREIHVLDLIAGPGGGRRVGMTGEDSLTARGGGDAGDVLDAEARSAYEARLRGLQEEIQEAESFNDEGRATRLRAEFDAIVDELKRATGLGGRSRKAASESERARLNVQRTIKAAIKRLFDADHGLGRHLDETVRTGTYCSYAP